MVKLKQRVYDRYKKAVARIKNTEKELFITRDLLEELETDGYDLDVDEVNSFYARCGEILDEHYAAIKEFQVCDHNANYAMEMDISQLLLQRELMLKIMRCVSNTEDWDRESIAVMAHRFLKDSGVE